MSFLAIEGLTRRFGGLTAVNDISFTVSQGEILSIIGPNGAGKSTLFKLIGSFLKPTSGRVLLDGVVVSGRQPHQVAQTGIVRTFQETTVFKEMTALALAVLQLAAGRRRLRRRRLPQRRPAVRDPRRCGRAHRTRPPARAEGDSFWRLFLDRGGTRRCQGFYRKRGGNP